MGIRWLRPCFALLALLVLSCAFTNRDGVADDSGGAASAHRGLLVEHTLQSAAPSQECRGPTGPAEGEHALSEESDPSEEESHPPGALAAASGDEPPPSLSVGKASLVARIGAVGGARCVVGARAPPGLS